MMTNTLETFENTTDELLKLLNSTSNETLNRKPSHGGWTAGQVVEHLLKSYAVIETLKGKTEPTKRQPDQKVLEVEKLFLNFEIKMDSPEAIVPSDKPKAKESLISALKDRIEEFTTIIKNKDLSVTCLDFAIPEYGSFTRLEWVWFNIVHTQRHVNQLKGVLENLK